MDSSISKFLRDYKVDGSNFTHVSMISPKGKYQLNRVSLEEFWSLYMDKVNNNSLNIGIAEKPRHYIPVLVDIDIKKEYDKDVSCDSLYTYELVENVIKSYQDVMKKIIDNCTDKHLICFLLEKPLYTVKKGAIEYVKNGFHLHFPYTFMSKVDQEVHLLPRVRRDLDDKKVFQGIGNGDIDSILDKSYTKIPWLLYGSKKEGQSHCYNVTKVYNHNCSEITLEESLKDYRIYDMNEDEIEIGDDINYFLPRILSIVGYGRPYVDVKTNLEQPLKARIQKVESKKTYVKKSLKQDLDLATKLVNLIDSGRAENFNDWMHVGWTLYNISDGCQEGLDLWLDFSKKCPEKFDENACVYEWNKMLKKNITIGTLKQKAQLDNPKEYKKIMMEDMKKNVDTSLSGSHNDIAKLMKKSEYGHEFVCSDIKHKNWYQFVNHRWKNTDEGVSLRAHISEDVVKIFNTKSNEIYTQLMDANSNNDEGDKAKYEKRLKDCWKMINNLKSSPYKNNIMKEAQEVFYDEHFNKKLDSNPWLIGFKNGVYDLKNHIFRDGAVDDYISMQLGVEYDNTFTMTHKDVISVYDFLEKVFPDKSVRNYFLDTTSDVFVGGNSRKLFHVWSGEGDNAKSVTQLLLEKMLGEYSVKLPTSLIIGKRTQASAACPELVRAGNGVRWAVLQEPDKKDILNIGILKELSGNDTFFARGLYQEGSEITPMFKLVLICNDPPQVPYSDKATWNRIRVIPFESTFCDDAPESFEEQLREKRFPKDPHFADKIPSLIKAFAWVLLNHRKNIKTRIEPPKVKLATEMYRKKNDIYRQFVDECVAESENSSLSLIELYSQFKEWFKEGCPNHAVPIKNEVKEYFVKYWGEPVKGCKWKGYKIRTLQDDLTNGDAFLLDEGDLSTYNNSNNSSSIPDL